MNNLLLILATLCFSFGVSQQATAQADKKDEGEVFRLLSTLGQDTDRLKFFFREVDITESQLDELIALFRDTKEELVKKQSLMNKLKLKLFSASEASGRAELSERIEEIEKDLKDSIAGFSKEFRSILLKHQVDGVAPTLRMRRSLQAMNLESFEFPLYSGVKTAGEDKTKLKAAIKKEKDSISVKQTELKQKAWKKILASMPKAQREKLRNLLGKRVQ